MTLGRAILAAFMGLSMGLWVFTARGHAPSYDECLEGSEFVLHAAMSRDGGMSRQDFIGRVQADLMAIQSFPPELRWFAQDEDDERFLVLHSEIVFDDPRSPHSHQSDFLKACVARMTSDSTRLGPTPEGVPSGFAVGAEESGL
jgi:hypothetical protein